MHGELEPAAPYTALCGDSRATRQGEPHHCPGHAVHSTVRIVPGSNGGRTRGQMPGGSSPRAPLSVGRPAASPSAPIGVGLGLAFLFTKFPLSIAWG